MSKTESLGSDLKEISKKPVLLGMEKADILSRKSNRMEIYCKTSDSSGVHQLVLPLYNYRGYHVTDGSGSEYEIINGEQNRVAFELPDGFDGRILVKFEDPVYWTISLVVSFAAFIALTIWVVFYAFRKSKNRMTV